MSYWAGKIRNCKQNDVLSGTIQIKKILIIKEDLIKMLIEKLYILIKDLIFDENFIKNIWYSYWILMISNIHLLTYIQ